MLYVVHLSWMYGVVWVSYDDVMHETPFHQGDI